MACRVVGGAGAGLVSWCVVTTKTKTKQRVSVVAIRAESMATEKLGIKIEKSPPESKLTQLGVRNWPKWGCPPSKFPWTYEAKETCYLLQGKVKVTPKGSKDSVEIEGGDLVEFPKGMSCTWDVSLAVDKHYNFS
ncbi:RmlC-like cupins superfamily protein [Trema orientale]|uniref:RmlC-like cupins superfamily protein n=1 Tax=Trema orientale TaxID=63057 RepID=A0A2P5E748_TREOI|nr:RmlC-like cupins superfamily protein [Trema orientale]